MKKEEAKSLCDSALSELAAALAAGKSEELTRYLNTMSRFHHYSFGNCLLIARQRPTATRVAGFQAWKKLGRSVKKGEKGICILAPMVGKKEDEEGNETKGVLGYRAVHVFDLAQTEGDELPDINRLSGEPGDHLERLVQYVSSLGIELGYEEHLDGADGVSMGGRIYLLSGLNQAEAYNTLAHELAHELMHKAEDRKTLSKTVKELEAESVAYVVSHAAGLSGALKQSKDYIQCHQGDPEQLTASLGRIQQAASQILTGIEAQQLEPEPLSA
ncbi:ArdC-like ssDNA-binding domain-containing protein [Botrimarina mediterranea]|uniref:N-terminal domain-containing protein n=1 Tax=Botrimarina mediterranea TaxID=2528022 RepID=A0A518K5Y4_9BACT|nr:ArdC-like ssDNA-binding domain-containing protein [Botrimarina mediterranea]QDV73206.1 hypothetical protein Spa11_14020 [Botrimarina mediterranea]